ncbi:phosphatase PAP2 family protein [Streptomyces sp. TP-A0874]|uniref:phosphatase PAP2 family protein n=1 Tax=Streptomyces sp. TP-A0874 TaxID=549819 RepID=UPI0008535EF8|nr:phosphatase PAP2 family protein [Streptomyces sp. TP-A0874]
MYRLDSVRRPRLWGEILLIVAGYWLYTVIRDTVPEQKTTALRNAEGLWHTEKVLGIAVEPAVNHTLNSVSWLITVMNYYYATLHFVVTIAVLVWLYHWRPGRYAPARLVLVVTTATGLLGYYLFPLAPPRLLPGGTFVDTALVHSALGSSASGPLSSLENEYAAMPSMHIGWSVWCAVVIVVLARPLWVKALGVLYPLVTLVVIVATANHFWLDAVGGLLCLAIGYAVSLLWYDSLGPRLRRRRARDRTPRAEGR